jgi:hypothetical protein
MAKSKRTKKTKHQATDIRPDLQRVIETVFPDDIVELPYEREEGELDELYETVRPKLLTLLGTGLFYELPADDKAPTWDDDDDASWDSYPIGDVSYSYRRYFLGLADPKYQITEPDEEMDENEHVVEVERTETLGCIVALCEFAPVAIVKLDSMGDSGEWGHTVPDICDHVFEPNGEPADPEAFFSEWFGTEAVAQAREMREAIVGELESLRITVIPGNEAKKAVPWLKAGEEVICESVSMGKPITVRDAFFFMVP